MTDANETLRKDRIVRWPEVHDFTGLGKRTVDELEARGLFPKRRSIAPRATGWIASEVEAWFRNLEVSK